ncbi:MAG: ABC transporter permease subunit [Gammaproteobacteria bacterium]|nr:ABC transporter permease subunit [Gammaproteobacteria bacterium]
MRIIAWRELKNLFLSPLAWAILIVTHVILCYQFLTQLEAYMQFQAQLSVSEHSPGMTDLVIAPLLKNTAIVLLMIIPLLTMRLISEEQKNKTLSLLFSAPISMTHIILGKYLGILSFLLILVMLITLMPLSLLLGTAIDLRQLASAVLGLCLVLASFTAVGLYMSTRTKHPAIAAISSFGILLLLWMINFAGHSTYAEHTLHSGGGSVLNWFSLLNHFEPLLNGVVSSADIAYYCLFISLFLVFSIRRLDYLRLSY